MSWRRYWAEAMKSILHRRRRSSALERAEEGDKIVVFGSFLTVGEVLMAQEQQDVETLKRKGRRRLVGAVALVLAAVIVLPMVFDPEPRGTGSTLSVRIPAEDETPFRRSPREESSDVSKESPRGPGRRVCQPAGVIAKLQSAKMPYYTERVHNNLTRVRAGPFPTRDCRASARPVEGARLCARRDRLQNRDDLARLHGDRDPGHLDRVGRVARAGARDAFARRLDHGVCRRQPAARAARRKLPANMRPEFRVVAAFVTVFVGTLVLTTLLSALVTKFVKVSVLHSLDRWLGALFGLLRGLVILVALAMVAG